MRAHGAISDNMSKRLELLQEMLKIDTSNCGETVLAEALAKRLSAAGIEVALAPVEGNRSNLVARLPGKSSHNRLMFNAHLDTVPPMEGWTKDPFGGEIVDGKIYGRGASDTKSSLAAMASALIELSQEQVCLERDIILLGTAGEETDLAGARAFVATGGMVGVGCLVVGEPTNQVGKPLRIDLVNVTKGCFVGVLKTKGLSSHGANPEEGINAILRMTQYLEWLRQNPPYAGYRRDPDLGPPTWAPTVMKAGEAENMIPDSCTVTLDLRPIPGMDEEDSLRPFREAAEKIWGSSWQEVIEISGRHFLPSIQCNANNPALVTALQIATDCGITTNVRSFFGASDASFLRTDAAMPFFIFGPGIENMAHKPDEYAQVEDYLASIEFYKEFALRLA